MISLAGVRQVGRADKFTPSHFIVFHDVLRPDRQTDGQKARKKNLFGLAWGRVSLGLPLSFNKAKSMAEDAEGRLGGGILSWHRPGFLPEPCGQESKIAVQDKSNSCVNVVFHGAFQ